MTPNAGAREMSANAIGFGSQSANMDSQGLKAIEKAFTPEFRNRLDGIVQFNHLSAKVMEMIVDKNMKELKTMLKAKEITLSYSAKVRTFLAKKGYDTKFGARPLARYIQTNIKDKLTDEILFGKLANGGKISIGLICGCNTCDRYFGNFGNNFFNIFGAYGLAFAFSFEPEISSCFINNINGFVRQKPVIDIFVR